MSFPSDNIDDYDDGVKEAINRGEEEIKEYVQSYYDSLTHNDIGRGFFHRALETFHCGPNLPTDRDFYTSPRSLDEIRNPDVTRNKDSESIERCCSYVWDYLEKSSAGKCRDSNSEPHWNNVCVRKRLNAGQICHYGQLHHIWKLQSFGFCACGELGVYHCRRLASDSQGQVRRHLELPYRAAV